MKIMYIKGVSLLTINSYSVIQFCRWLADLAFAKKKRKTKQGWIHGTTFEDGWAGAMMQKTISNSKMIKTEGPMNRLTQQCVELHVRDSKMQFVR